MELTIGCIIQARMGSSRLPGKVLMKIEQKKTVLEFIINQLKQSKLIEKIIIATTVLDEDEQIVNLSKEMNISYFRGHPKDVLDRYYECAKHFSLSSIVRITSDNPLIDPTLVDHVIEKFMSGSFDYVTNFLKRTFPYGTEAEIISFNALEKTWINAKKPSEREHVTLYVLNNENDFRIGEIRNDVDLSHLRWTIDRENDLILAKNLVEKIKERPILMKNILKILSSNPELIEISKDNSIDEGYKKPLLQDKEFEKLD